jgi:hypothetical protein
MDVKLILKGSADRNIGCQSYKTLTTPNKFQILASSKFHEK